MDFFEQQERARRSSRWLVLWYLLAVLSVVASYCVVAALVYAFEAAAADGVLRLSEAELVRMVAATLDCPVPPLLAAQDPQVLAA